MTAPSEPRSSAPPSALAPPSSPSSSRPSSPAWCCCVTGDDVAGFWSTLLTWPEGRNIVNILNATAILYISGVAAAIGFRMNLFNIGVEGQYRVATFAAAAFAGAGWLPGKLNTVVADPGRHAGRRPVGRHRRHPARPRAGSAR